MFLLSPPDCLDYVKRPLFQVAVATYLGQPCPLMAPLVRKFFGKSGSQLDKYGANLAAAPSLGTSGASCTALSSVWCRT